MLILQYKQGVPPGFDISSPSDDGDSASLSPMYDLYAKPDGTALFWVETDFGGNNDKVNEAVLSPVWDALTATSGNSKVVGNDGESFPYTVAFNDTGTKMVMSGTQTNIIYEYTLSTPWQPSSAGTVQVGFDMDSRNGSNVRTIRFNDDGTKLFFAAAPSGGPSGNFRVFEVTLTSAYTTLFGVGTEVTYDITPYTTGVFTDEIGLAFNNDGTRLFTMSSGNMTIYQHSLSTAWDISTASYDSVSFNVSGTQAGAPRGVAFKDDGTKMYVTNGDKIAQYSL